MPVIGCDTIARYRNKLEFTFSNRRYLLPAEMETAVVIIQNNAFGFHVPRLFDKVIDINICHLMVEPTNSHKKYHPGVLHWKIIIHFTISEIIRDG